MFAAAEAHGVRRVVWASSETVLGLPFDTPPLFAPIDETIEPRPESSYALSKLVGETMAAQFARRTGIALRRPADLEHHGARRLRAVSRRYWDDARLRKWNLWGYVDARDVAQAARLGLEADVDGAEVCIVAAADTVMTRPSAELMAEVFPTVPLRRPVEGRETLLAIDRPAACSATSPPTAGRTTWRLPSPGQRAARRSARLRPVGGRPVRSAFSSRRRSASWT